MHTKKNLLDLKIRVTPAQKLWLAETAALEGTSASQVIRNLIKQAILKAQEIDFGKDPKRR